MNKIFTHFAPAERAGDEVVFADKTLVTSNTVLPSILESLPYVAAILNAERQIIFVNKILLSLFDYSELDQVVGKRLGESIHCIHAFEEEGGCGTSESCEYCGAVQSMMECLDQNKDITKETRITSKRGDNLDSFDFSIKSTPIVILEKNFMILTIRDISDEKRRQMLERIFFHDVLNKAGSMDGLVEMLEEMDDPKEIKRMLSVIQTVTHELVGEIKSQRDLSAVQNGDFELSITDIDPRVEIAEIAEQMRHHMVSKGKTIDTLIASETPVLKTDKVLLNRVLTNMLKNAMEATKPGQSVLAMVYDVGDAVGFCIQNSSVMPAHVKSQVFQRSFSTKGSNRGLGTYSIKLLGEKFLGGKVHFTSTQEDGTQFVIEIPKKQGNLPKT